MIKRNKIGVKEVVLSLLCTMALIYYFQVSTGNIAGIVFFVLILILLQYREVDVSRREKVLTGIFSAIISCLIVMGKLGRTNESILDALKKFQESYIKDLDVTTVYLSGYGTFADKVILLITMIGIGIICYFLLLKSVRIIHESISFYDDEQKINNIFWKSFFVIMLCWLPYFIVNYPGVLVYDSIHQISQIEGILELTNHHPAVHTMLISLCYNLGKALFDSGNVGVAIYTVLQMCILSAIYSNMISVLYKNNLKKRYCILIIAYFALLPLHAMSAITMTKDYLFAGFVLWFTVSLYQIFVNEDMSVKVICQMIISASLLILFRSNGIYAYVLCIPFLLYFLKNNRKKFLLYLGCPLLVYALVLGPVYDFIGVQKPGDIVESISIPMQHVARVVVERESDLTDSERKLIEKTAPIELIKETYNCRFSDPMKNLMWDHGAGTQIGEHKADYLKLWLVLGLKYPWQYIKAEIDATVGYWYPDEQYTTISTGIYPNDFGLSSLLHEDSKIYTMAYKWYNLYRYIPVLGNLFSMGTMFVLMVFAIYKHLYDKNKRFIGFIVPTLMVWVTIMIATPLQSEMRYMYSVMITAPIIFCSNFIEDISLPKKKIVS